MGPDILRGFSYASDVTRRIDVTLSFTVASAAGLVLKKLGRTSQGKIVEEYIYIYI